MGQHEDTKHVAEIFKALGNESRLSIAIRLMDREQSVSELVEATGLSQPLISQHLKTLREVHVVQGVREGKTMRYSLADTHVAHILNDTFTHASEGECNDH